MGVWGLLRSHVHFNERPIPVTSSAHESESMERSDMSALVTYIAMEATMPILLLAYCIPVPIILVIYLLMR